MPRAAMIFAAGFGTRMAPLTDNQPKALVKVNGRALIDHALELTEKAGITNRVVNTHHFADQIAAHLADVPNLSLSVEQPHPFETGGGLRAAMPLLGRGPVFTLNPDAIWTGGNPLTELATNWQPGEMGALLMLIAAKNIAGYDGPGDFCMEASGKLSRNTSQAGQIFVYSGAQILHTEPLTAIPESVFSLNVLWDRLIEKGRLFGCVHTGGWVDVGTPAGIKRAQDMLSRDKHV